ncbi:MULTISPECIES: hypothetical protein [Microbacterium]|uniref:Uncharacterized protein n=1 Tax=Microbacterium trichothecenolyticum TaxID=69370 RepID=A0A0M2HB18_MICTR|nr:MULTISPECIES: hypothetical protein [Microbacterium]KJL43798.1 hypothetical protein RS82_01174 [Microbacterium trichothecenolyticum]MDR7191216.1 hypothetical protein [Microbacterium sp. BE35]
MGDEKGTPEEGRPGAAAEPTGHGDATEATSDGHGTEPTSAGGGTRLTTGMRTVLWIVAAVVVLGIAVTIWLLTIGSGTAGVDGADPDAGSTPTATVTQGPIPGATPTTGSEVQPPDETAAPIDRLPPLPTSSPLVSDPLPASGSASGELVKGFPVDLMGPVPDSQVLESSISTEGSTMQVSLVARTDAADDDVRAHYRELWADLGLTDTSGGDGSITYSDAFSSLSLAFSESSGTGTVYMIYGVFRTS